MAKWQPKMVLEHSSFGSFLVHGNRCNKAAIPILPVRKSRRSDQLYSILGMASNYRNPAILAVPVAHLASDRECLDQRIMKLGLRGPELLVMYFNKGH